MGTVEILIISGTMIVVVGGGLAIFFWWRKQYGVWSRPTESGGQPYAGGGTVISDDFDTRLSPGAQPGNPPFGSAGVASGVGSADAAERLRMVQLGTVMGMVGGSAMHAGSAAVVPGHAAGDASRDRRGRDSADDLSMGATEPPLAPDAGDPVTPPAESDRIGGAAAGAGFSLGSLFGLGGSSSSGSDAPTESSTDSGAPSDSGGSYDSGSSDSGSSDSGSSSGGDS